MVYAHEWRSASVRLVYIPKSPHHNLPTHPCLPPPPLVADNTVLFAIKANAINCSHTRHEDLPAMHTTAHVPEEALEAIATAQPEVMRSPAREMIAILDYGSQYSRLIARRVRECHVYCELLPASTTLDDLQRLGAKGVILSGGPDSVYDDGARQLDQAILDSDLPVLGICYGMHLLAHQLGGHVEPHTGRREYGPARI